MPPKFRPDGPFGFVEPRTPREGNGDRGTLRVVIEREPARADDNPPR
eukprot:COSAG04_NODE_30504_length_262_cov_0.638037_1_plen_46_part_10